MRTGNPLSVELGPGMSIFLFNNYCLGILKTIFDGIQRPLETIANDSKSVFVPKGVDIPSLDQNHEWHFTPRKDLKVGDLVSGGDVIGFTFENDLFSDHKIMIPPKVYGRVTEI